MKQIIFDNDVYKLVSFRHSMSWKANSRKLLLHAKTFESFKKAVVWCGRHGNVTRTIKEGNIDVFARYVFSRINKIKNGTFDLINLPSFGNGVPKSFACKLCHIISPKHYPVIYDSKTRDALGAHAIRKFLKMVNKISIKYNIQSLSIKEIFKFDSEIWAYGEQYLHYIHIL